ncbi:hypothetical protein HZH68_011097 [Vespula germanica]|uniref:Ig-like domain-containing protein n=1 Tax=Vespula germanica TaxID=30212 RepID=A0A834JNI5_VESGE|nr:hypothetical protein HZH68_011097 [Vespula germanica]
MYLSLYFIFSTHDRFTTVAESQSRYLVHTYEHGALLRIEPVKTARDSTTYECVAENGVGDAVSAEAQLTVYEGERIPTGAVICRGPPPTPCFRKRKRKKKEKISMSGRWTQNGGKNTSIHSPLGFHENDVGYFPRIKRKRRTEKKGEEEEEEDDEENEEENEDSLLSFANDYR